MIAELKKNQKIIIYFALGIGFIFFIERFFISGLNARLGGFAPADFPRRDKIGKGFGNSEDKR